MAGADAARILAWLKQHPQLAAGEQARLLARVFDEQFVLEAGEFRPRGKGELESGRVQNPLDPEATYAVKQQGGEAKSHVGYKAQVAETVVERKLEAGEPTSNFITASAGRRIGSEPKGSFAKDLRRWVGQKRNCANSRRRTRRR